MSDEDFDDKQSEFINECVAALNDAFTNFINTKHETTVISLNAHVSMLTEFVYYHLETLNRCASMQSEDFGLDKLVLDSVHSLISCHGYRQSDEYKNSVKE